MRCDQIRSVLKCLAQKRQGVPTFYKAPACPLTQGLVGSFLKVCGPPSLVSRVHNHLPGIDDSLWGPGAPLKTPSLISQLVGLTPCYHERMGPPKNSILKHFPGKDLWISFKFQAVEAERIGASMCTGLRTCRGRSADLLLETDIQVQPLQKQQSIICLTKPYLHSDVKNRIIFLLNILVPSHCSPLLKMPQFDQSQTLIP